MSEWVQSHCCASLPRKLYVRLIGIAAPATEDLYDGVLDAGRGGRCRGPDTETVSGVWGWVDARVSERRVYFVH